MKQYFIYIVSALFLVACSNDSDVAEEPWLWGDGVSVVVPDVEMFGEEAETRALTYNLSSKVMKFSWQDDSKIGVFPVKEPSSSAQQQCFVKTDDPIVVDDNSVTARFQSQDGGVKTVDGNTHYVSYFPYVEPSNLGLDGFDYSKIPVTYLGQTQASNVNIKAYANRAASDENMTLYNNSEIPACAHLEKYDYLASDATSTSEGHVHFVYSRLGAVLRFFIQVPEAIIYDSLHFVNKDKAFMVEGTMDVLNKTLTPTKQSHQVPLVFNGGFDLTNTSGDSYTNTATNAGYIIAYMMMAPIELKSVNQCELYLCGHTADVPSVKRYFKAIPLKKMDILIDKLQQWVPTVGVDEPITFTAIEVEEWKTGTGFTNGDGGKGTEGW